MLRNFLLIAWRQLYKHKGYSFIHIVGLGLAMAIALLIGLWITDECSFDHHHTGHARIAEVMIRQQEIRSSDGRPLPPGEGKVTTSASISTVLGPALRRGYETIFRRTALANFPMPNRLFNYGEHAVSAKAMWVEPTFPEIFTYRMVAGSARSLEDPSSLLLSQSTAKALFGNSDAIGKVVRYNNKLGFRVGGVYEDQPFNSSFYDVAVLLPWENQAAAYLNTNTDWNNHNATCFVQLADGVSPQEATAHIQNLPTSHVSEYRETLLVFPLDRLHLHDEFHGQQGRNRIRMVWLLGTIGAFILLLACINFMNLSTARSEKRAREVGIRKTIGSTRTALVAQFFGESILTSFVALLIAIGMAFLALPLFNQLAGKQLVLPVTSVSFWAATLGVALFTGIVAGSYPAFYLSAFRPVRVLKGAIHAGRGASLARQILVVTQFTVSLSLVIATVIIFRQIELGKDRPVGYRQQGLVTVDLNTDTLSRSYDALRRDLLGTGQVAGVAESSYPTTGFLDGNPLQWVGQRRDQTEVEYRNVTISPEFGPVIGWTVQQGRDFSRAYPTDSDAMVINEAALKASGFRSPIGQRVKLLDHDYAIIGVVSNLLTNSPYEPIEPAVFTLRGYILAITIRVRPDVSMHTATRAMERVFKRYNPASPFLYHFNDLDYGQKFAEEDRIGDLATVAATLAIVISCLGLFGLASFVAEQRTREMGIRKVLGASVPALWALLSKEFARPVFLSMGMALPLAWWGMHQWLQGFVLRTSLSWWIFAAAAAGLVLVAFLTVSYQTIKAALRNPVTSLRSE